MLVWSVSDALHKSWGRQMAAVGAAVALTACAVLSAHQVQYWQNSETLFRRATQVTSSNYLAFNNLGFYLSGKGKIDEAMENYRKALEINPLYEDAQNNLGYALAGRKQYAEAISRYQAALQIRPNHVEVHNNLGNALADNVTSTKQSPSIYSFSAKSLIMPIAQQPGDRPGDERQI